MMVVFKRIALDFLSDQQTQPLALFSVGDVLCPKNSEHTLTYRVSRIQLIENVPYYHLRGSDGSYRIIPHTRIELWRKATENEG